MLLFQHGLQQPDGIETGLGTAIGKLPAPSRPRPARTASAAAAT
jgi:hypothetical protein